MNLTRVSSACVELFDLLFIACFCEFLVAMHLANGKGLCEVIGNRSPQPALPGLMRLNTQSISNSISHSFS